jgi:hypothetical protein
MGLHHRSLVLGHVRQGLEHLGLWLLHRPERLFQPAVALAPRTRHALFSGAWVYATAPAPQCPKGSALAVKTLNRSWHWFFIAVLTSLESSPCLLHRPTGIQEGIGLLSK